MGKIDVVKHILRHTNHGQFINNNGGYAWAPSNVALCKYWGKRDHELNLPVTSSLSISLGTKGAFTHIKQEGGGDKYIVNGNVIGGDTKFAERLKVFLDLFRPHGAYYLVETITNVPIAAGFASSACGFAALVQALNNLYDWRLNKQELSVLARLGSGSACRSLHEGFVEWQVGEFADGMDSYGVKLDYIWPELRIGMLTVSAAEKPISSREAMQHTVNTSPLYSDWAKLVESDLSKIKLALKSKDFMLLGEVAENNAIAMHMMMKFAQPAVVYSLPETFALMRKVQELRASGVPVFFTQDAGANLQLLFLAEQESAVLATFSEIEIVMPFIDLNSEQLVLVDEKDIEIGAGEKLAVHIQGKLHRAFSVVVLRKHNDRIEVLLQQRAATKYHSAGLWSNTCCGHPRPGEKLEVAAEKRLYEEMGFSVKLKEVGQFHYMAKLDSGLIENELDHVLVGFSELDDFLFNEDEVQDYCWIDLADLKQDLQDNSSEYTIWLPSVLDKL